MAKLSQQSDQSIRQSRTQRVVTSQKSESEQRKFEDLKKRADRIREEKFAGVSAEKYGEVYDTLDADIKPFFATGSQVLQQKSDSIATTKQDIQNKIAEIQLERAKDKAYYKKREDYYHDKYKKTGKETYKERSQRYEDKGDEYDDEHQGRIKGLNEGLKKLNSNQDVDFKSIWSYAKDVGNYEQDKERAKNKNISDFNKQKAQGDLDKTFEQLGLSKSQTSYSEFKRSVKTYNKSVDINRVSIDAWQQANPTEKLIYDSSGNIAGVESGALKQSISIENYQRVTSPEYIYDQWQKKNPIPKTVNELLFQQSRIETSPFDSYKPSKKDVPFKIITAGKELPYGFGSQQTSIMDASGNIVAPSLMISDADYEKIKSDKSTPIGDLWGGAVAGAKWIDERVHYTGRISEPISFGKIEKLEKPTVQTNIFFTDQGDLKILKSSSKDAIDTRTFEEKYGMTMPESAVNLGISKLKGKKQDIEEWVIGKENIEKFGADIETKYQGKYQYQFEQKYMKDLIFNETDFETASSQFKESAEAKALQKQFEKEYGSGYKDLQTDVGFWKGTAGGVGVAGLSLAQLGLGVVKTPTRVAGATAGVLTGAKILGAVPTAVNLGISGGLGIYGTYKFLDPSSTYIERGSGLVTAVISGATLGYAGVKYLKSPVVKRVIEKAPISTFKSTGVIGKDIKIIKDGVTTNKVIYQSQKLSQIGKAGSRTIVTTKGRVLSSSFWRKLGVSKKLTSLDSNAIYRGIPSQQLGYTKDFALFRITKLSGREKAFNLLKKYGWSSSQAQSTLRYTAPRVYESYLSKGVITVKGAKATAYFEHLIKRPVITVNKNLGIKTRGGATLKDITKIQRQLVKDASGNAFVKYTGVKGSGFVDKAGKFKDWKDIELMSGKSYVKAFDQKGFEYLGKQGGIDAWKPNQAYKDIFAFSKKDALKIKISKTRANLNIDLDLNPLRNLEVSNAKLYNQIINLDKGKNVWAKPINIKKTPFPTYDPKIDPISKSSSDVMQKIMNKIDKVDDFKPTGYKSKYFGSGQYEQSFGGLSPKEILQNQNLLKSPIDVRSVKIGSGIKDAILIKQLELGNVLKVSNIASLTSMSALGLENAPNLKINLKTNYALKNLLKEDVFTKTAQVPALKTSPALKSQLKSILDLDLGSPLASSPVLKSPSIPKIPSPTIPKPFVIPFLKAKIKKGSSGKKQKGFNELTYLPDFTSRALGLKSETISQKQAKAKLKKLLTGLEIRRGVKIK